MAEFSNPVSFPEIIDFRPGNDCTMTFLINEPFLSRMHFAATDKEIPSVPLHWHELHDELFRVLKGRIRVRIGNETRTYVPEDGEVRIPKRTLHSLNFFSGEECIFEERTEPMDEEKEMFFRNLHHLMEEKRGLVASLFHATLIFYHGDLRPALPWHFPWLEKAFVISVGGYLAPLLGYKLKYYVKAKSL